MIRESTYSVWATSSTALPTTIEDLNATTDVARRSDAPRANVTSRAWGRMGTRSKQERWLPLRLAGDSTFSLGPGRIRAGILQITKGRKGVHSSRSLMSVPISSSGIFK